MTTKAVCFAGHRYPWNNVGVEAKLPTILENLINQGYDTFYVGFHGYFDEIVRSAILQLKRTYSHIKVIAVITYYHENKDKWDLGNVYDGTVYPDVEEVHYKQKIIVQNRWLVDNCDVVVCHVKDTHRSGAYKTVRYAVKQGKSVVEV